MLIEILIIVLIVIRIVFALCIENQSDELISEFTDYLIANEKYNCRVNYATDLEMGTMKYIISIWMWKKYSIIKPEYIEELLNFKARNDIRIKEDMKIRVKEIKESMKEI